MAPRIRPRHGKTSSNGSGTSDASRYLILTDRGVTHLFDRQARKYLGMSGAEFAQRLHSDDVDDLDPSSVRRVSMLMPAKTGN